MNTAHDTHGHNDSHGHGETHGEDSSWVWLIGIIIGTILLFWIGLVLFSNFNSSSKNEKKENENTVTHDVFSTENIDKYTRTQGSVTFIIPNDGLTVTVGEYHYYRTNKKVRIEIDGSPYYLKGKDWVGPAMPSETSMFTIYPTESGETSFTFIKI